MQIVGTDPRAASAAKIERLAEALENLAIGVVSKGLEKVAPENKPSKMVDTFMEDARSEIRVSLKEFLQPTLTLFERGSRQRNAVGDEVTCLRCRKHICCGELLCKDWHAAVQVAIDKAPPEDPPPLAA